MTGPFILPLSQVGLEDLPSVGGKNASLGEMIRHLDELGINIPNGFVITVDVYRQFIRANELDAVISQIIADIDFKNIASLRRSGLRSRQLITNSKYPKDLSELIINAYYALSATYEQAETDVAVRSSATAEDLPDASFAGQQETYLNVRGPASLIDAVRNCFASLFTDRAISYRESLKYDHFQLALSVCVQKMVRSDLAASGVAFSIDPETGFRDVVVVNGSYGLGEMIVQGAVLPDEFIVFKPTLKDPFQPIIEKKLGVKDKMMIYGNNPDQRVTIIPTEKTAQQKFCIDDEKVLQLSKWVVEIEKYYSHKKGK